MKKYFPSLFQPIPNPGFLKLFLVIIPLVAGILIATLRFTFIDTRSDFMMIAWNPGREFLTTGSIDIDYPYPAWTVAVMLPFVVWPPQIAMVLWFICNVLMLSASIALFITLFDWGLSLIFFGLVVALASVFPPILTSVLLGQLTIFPLLVLALTAYLFLRQRWGMLGIVLGLSLIKPHLMILLTGLLLLWALWHRRWRILLGFSATTIVLVSISIPIIADPRQLIGGGISNHLDIYIQQTSTLWGLFLSLGISWLVPLAISLVLLIWLGWIWVPFLRGTEISADRIIFLFSAATMVNLMVVPYSWMHNLVLLFLPLGYALTQILKIKGRAQTFWLALLFVIMHPLMITLFVIFDKVEFPQAYQAIPALALLLFMFFFEPQTPSSNFS